MRDTRGEAVARVVDWSQRQEPRREPSADGPRLTEEDLFAAYSVGIRRGGRASFPIAVRRARRDDLLDTAR